MNLKTILLAAPLATAALFAHPAAAAEYVQDSGVLTFASEYQGEIFTGTFPGFRTTLDFDPAAPQDARLDVVIPLASASTDNAERDNTLQSADFFNVARFAQARYTARGFRSTGGNGYAADGTLELRGIRKPVTLTLTWTPGERPLLTGKAAVSRLDFGVGGGDWADTGIIPDVVAISTRVHFTPAP